MQLLSSDPQSSWIDKRQRAATTTTIRGRATQARLAILEHSAKNAINIQKNLMQHQPSVYDLWHARDVQGAVSRLRWLHHGPAWRDGAFSCQQEQVTVCGCSGSYRLLQEAAAAGPSPCSGLSSEPMCHKIALDPAAESTPHSCLSPSDYNAGCRVFFLWRST